MRPRGWWSRLLRVVRRDPALEDRIDEETVFHLEMRAAELEARGLLPADAARAARVAFGNRTAHAESVREARTSVRLASAWRGLRLALRSLRRRPGLVATAVISLGLGIGANAAIFSVLDAVALRPLPVPTLDRLASIQSFRDGRPVGGNPRRLLDFGEQVGAFEAIAGYYAERPVLLEDDGPVRVPVLRVVGDLLRATGHRPVAGRGFTAAESAGEPVALLRARAASRWFGSPAAAVGGSVKLDGRGYTVVGVLGDDVWPLKEDLWIPVGRDLQSSRLPNFLPSVALIRAGVSSEAAAAELDLVIGRLAREYPATDADRSARLVPLQTALVGAYGRALLVVFAIGLVVLAAACLNLAGLLLSRAVERQRESAIRAALGAGRASLVRLYFAESALLGLGGGLLGLGVAWLVLQVLGATSLPFDLPRLAEARLDGRVTGVVLALTAGAVVLFGALPALVAARGSLGPSMSRSPVRGRLQAALVSLQAALALVLLLAASTLVDAFRRLRLADDGFDPAPVLAVRIDFPWETPQGAVSDVVGRALEAFATIPGVAEVGVTDRLPLAGETQSSGVRIAGRTLPPDLETMPVGVRSVSAGYFAAMGLPIVQGRVFDRPRTAVVNARFAREFLGGRPIGARPTLFGDEEFEVVGVVPDVRQSAATAEVMPEVFVDQREVGWALKVFLLRTNSGDPTSVAAAARARVRDIDPALVIDEIAPLERKLAEAGNPSRLLAWLLGGFAAVTALLVGLGLWGMLAGVVAQRTTEIGVRLALGASAASVIRSVAGRGVLLAGIGAAAGAGVWLWLGRAITRLPVDAIPAGPVATAVGLAVFLAAAAAVSLGPARRAARVSPMIALRAD